MTKVFNPADFRLLRAAAPRYSHKMPERTSLPRRECPLMTDAQTTYTTRFGASMGEGSYRALPNLDYSVWN